MYEVYKLGLMRGLSSIYPVLRPIHISFIWTCSIWVVKLHWLEKVLFYEVTHRSIGFLVPPSHFTCCGTNARFIEHLPSFAPNTHKLYIFRHCISIVYILQKKNHSNIWWGHSPKYRFSCTTFTFYLLSFEKLVANQFSSCWKYQKGQSRDNCIILWFITYFIEITPNLHV
jgi:hypothetical protein